MITPPSGSKIVVQGEGIDTRITLLSSSSGQHFFVIPFLFFWLGGWLFGEVSVLYKLIAGSFTPDKLFLLFWLGAWTVAGSFALRVLYLMVRPTRPESLLLQAEEIVYQEPPFTWITPTNGYRRLQPKLYKKTWASSRTYIFSRAEMKTLTLRDAEINPRLTVDQGIDRISLAENATEIEREWLFSVLQTWQSAR